MERKVIEMFIDELDQEQGINAVSIVTDPAIESFPVFLSKQKPLKLAEVDKERQILMGALLIPDKEIFRRDEETGEEYYIKFRDETVRKCLAIMMKRGKLNNTTEEHQIELEGNSVVEAWIKEDMKKDKSAIYGLNDPVGSLMISLHVPDKEKYNEYKKNGMAFSLEGAFTDQVKMSKNQTKKEEKRIYSIDDKKMTFLDKLKELVLSEASTEIKLEEMKTDTGVTVYADAFEPGNAVYVLDEDGNRTPAPEGEIPLENGNMLVVDAEGMIVSIGEPKPEEEQEMEKEKEAKKVVETTSKETHFEENKEVLFSDEQKGQLKEMFKEFYEEILSASEKKEGEEENKEKIEASKAKPLKHSPEKHTEVAFKLHTEGRNSKDRIVAFLNNK